MKSLLCAVALAALPLSGWAGEVEVPTATGTVAVQTEPQKLVVLDLAALDTLDALGVRADGAPAIKPPAYLAEAMAGLPTVGTLFEPDFEALAAMGPDLIVAGGRSRTQIQPLSAIAPTLDMTIDGTDLIAEVRERTAAYGTIFGREAQAAEAIAALDAEIEKTRAAMAGKGRALILLTNGGKMSAYGAGSRFGWLHDALGLPPADPELKVANHGEAVSFEYVAQLDPDWILVIDRGAAVDQGGEAAAATLDNPLIAKTTAGQKGRIVYLDGAAMYLATGGLRAVTGTLQQLAEAFGAAEG